MDFSKVLIIRGTGPYIIDDRLCGSLFLCGKAICLTGMGGVVKILVSFAGVAGYFRPEIYPLNLIRKVWLLLNIPA